MTLHTFSVKLCTFSKPQSKVRSLFNISKSDKNRHISRCWHLPWYTSDLAHDCQYFVVLDDKNIYVPKETFEIFTLSYMYVHLFLHRFIFSLNF